MSNQCYSKYVVWTPTRLESNADTTHSASDIARHGVPHQMEIKLNSNSRLTISNVVSLADMRGGRNNDNIMTCAQLQRFTAQQGIGCHFAILELLYKKGILLCAALNCLNQVRQFYHIPISQLSKVNPCCALVLLMLLIFSCMNFAFLVIILFQSLILT